MAFIIWGLVFGSIGFVLFMYGKSQKAPVPLLCGVSLMIYPYFLSNTIALVVVGVILSAIPYFVRL